MLTQNALQTRYIVILHNHHDISCVLRRCLIETALFDLIDDCLAEKRLRDIERESGCSTLAEIAQAERTLKWVCDGEAKELFDGFKSLYVNMMHDKCYFFNARLPNIGTYRNGNSANHRRLQAHLKASGVRYAIGHLFCFTVPIAYMNAVAHKDGKFILYRSSARARYRNLFPPLSWPVLRLRYPHGYNPHPS